MEAHRERSQFHLHLLLGAHDPVTLPQRAPGRGTALLASPAPWSQDGEQTPAPRTERGGSEWTVLLLPPGLSRVLTFRCHTAIPRLYLLTIDLRQIKNPDKVHTHPTDYTSWKRLNWTPGDGGVSEGTCRQALGRCVRPGLTPAAFPAVN